MATGVRDDMIRSASRIVRQNGVRGTSFARVLEHSGAPRGSIAHHFPGGKSEMVRAAVASSAHEVSEALARLVDAGSSSAELAGAVCGYFADGLERSGYRAGCPVAAVAHEPDAGEPLMEVAREASRTWRSLLVDVLLSEGQDDVQASRLATSVLALVEGGIVLARLERSREPMDQVAATCQTLLVERLEQ